MSSLFLSTIHPVSICLIPSINPSTHRMMCLVWVVRLVRLVPLNSSHPCLCVSPLCCITHTHVWFFYLFLFLLWLVGTGWSPGWLLAPWLASPFLTLWLRLLDHICLMPLLSLLLPLLHSPTNLLCTFINHSCECFWLVVCFCSYWYYLVSEFQCVSQSVCYTYSLTCLLVWLAACFMRFPFFETWAYVSFLFHVLGSAGSTTELHPSSYSPTNIHGDQLD